MKKITFLIISFIFISRIFAQDYNKDFDRKLRDFLKEKFIYSNGDSSNVKKPFLYSPEDSIYIYLAEFTFDTNGNIKQFAAYYLHNDTLKFYRDNFYFRSINFKDIPELTLTPPSKIFSNNFLVPLLYKKNVDDESNLFSQNQFSANNITLIFKILSKVINTRKKPYFMLNPLIIFSTKEIVN